MAPTTKATQKRLDAAFSSFNTHYADSKQWGEDRWYNSLYPALMQPAMYCAVLNRYAVGEGDGPRILTEGDESLLEKVDLPSLGDKNGSSGTTDSVAGVNVFQRMTKDRANVDAALHKTIQASTSTFPIPKPVPSSTNPLLTHWNMDAASVLAAHMLNVQPGDRVLDMCAAPGGKSIVLAQKLFPHFHKQPPTKLPNEDQSSRACLVSNELDTARFKRLVGNLKSYLPASLFPTPEIPQSQVRVINKDLSMKQSVASIPFGSGGYDRVLIDAPCSSERHIIHAYEKAKASGQVAEEMLNWKESHVSTLVRTQTGLLQTALKAVKLGGTVVYATCALGTEENDGVVEKVLEMLKTERKKAKRDGQKVDDWDIAFRLGTIADGYGFEDPVLQRMTESTRYGRIALPDHNGWGPLYFSVMVKISRTKRVKTGAK